MKEKTNIIQHIAPTLAAALKGPFASVATKFITDNLPGKEIPDNQNFEKILDDLLSDPKNLQKIKDIDQQFKLEMKKLDVDVLASDLSNKKAQKTMPNNKSQMLISIFFLIAYFSILYAIFFVEVSDSLNMKKGENSLMGELQVLIGVLTAGVGQILSYWFGSALKKQSPTPD